MEVTAQLEVLHHVKVALHKVNVDVALQAYLALGVYDTVADSHRTVDSQRFPYTGSATQTQYAYCSDPAELHSVVK